MTERQPKYFVGRFWTDQPYRCWPKAVFYEPGETGRMHRAGDVIWRGDDYEEGQRIAKEANRKKKL